jgi:antimicrobial peptide system SdpA family protein
MKSNRLWKISVWTAWILLSYFTIRSHNSTDYHIKYEMKKNLTFLWPQGWGFFTRDPQEAIISAYKLENGELTMLTVKNSSLENYLGFSRNTRFVTRELATILGSLPKDRWKTGKGDFKNQIPAKPDTTVTVKENFRFFQDGDYVFCQHNIIPLAWANMHQEKYQPYLILRVRILHEDLSNLVEP